MENFVYVSSVISSAAVFNAASLWISLLLSISPPFQTTSLALLWIYSPILTLLVATFPYNCISHSLKTAGSSKTWDAALSPILRALAYWVMVAWHTTFSRTVDELFSHDSLVLQSYLYTIGVFCSSIVLVIVWYDPKKAASATSSSVEESFPLRKCLLCCCCCCLACFPNPLPILSFVAGNFDWLLAFAVLSALQTTSRAFFPDLSGLTAAWLLCLFPLMLKLFLSLLRPCASDANDAELTPLLGPSTQTHFSARNIGTHALQFYDGSCTTLLILALVAAGQLSTASWPKEGYAVAVSGLAVIIHVLVERWAAGYRARRHLAQPLALVWALTMGFAWSVWLGTVHFCSPFTLALCSSVVAGLLTMLEMQLLASRGRWE